MSAMLHKSDSDDSNDSWREVSPTAFEQFKIIHQGYLTKHKVRDGTEASSTHIKPWKRRWFVLSHTGTEGVTFSYYKNEASINNGDIPIHVLLMSKCKKITTLPAHPKSDFTFCVEYEFKTLYLYSDTKKELDTWLKHFQETLNLDNRQILDPLKGLPQKKAKRRDRWFTNLTDPDSIDETEQDNTKEILPYPDKGTLFRSTSEGTYSQQIPKPPPLDGSTDPNIKVLSVKKLDV